ncbi:MAG: imidazole glycerol phosphate synthase subunit HisH [Desulfobacteraceae bacterium]|nr:MAG: imidazole glycerol phosphate synthase subunit HisH [Desulfobacteraceae bacterium]
MITIVDYGLGNIRAFANVYKNLNIECKIAKSMDDLNDSKKIILPGVGAFDHAMELLEKSGMRNLIDELVLQNHIPVLGICVGMQILALSSEEGKLPGLGWINAEVKKFDLSTFAQNTCLPHMGWNEVNAASDSGLLKGLEPGSRFYFLHSYYFSCRNEGHIIAQANYGKQFCCAVNDQNIYGVQFHPEKSHRNGIQLLKNFAEL